MLTDTQCRAARPRENAYKLADGGPVLEVKPNGVKAWRYRFKLNTNGVTKESMFAIGDDAVAPRGETPEQAKARRDGGRFTLAEARDERMRARDLVKPPAGCGAVRERALAERAGVRERRHRERHHLERHHLERLPATADLPGGAANPVRSERASRGVRRR